MNIVIVGGGAAGFFAAIQHKRLFPKHSVQILEQSPKVLSKVKISGGGRCNVTNACSKPSELIKNYPRGGKELQKAFEKFSSVDTVAWFAEQGVELKTEADHRMFPVSDDSQTIIDCFLGLCHQLSIPIRTQTAVENLEQKNGKWEVQTNKGFFEADKILMATGSSPKMWHFLERKGHGIEKPLPSLFTFDINDPRLDGLAGVAVPTAQAEVMGTKLKEKGAVLITHWGLSAPAILRLSAWGAKELAERNYHFKVRINWIPEYSFDKLQVFFQNKRQSGSQKQIMTNPLFGLPARLWQRLCETVEMPEKIRWADAPNKFIFKLAEQLTLCTFEVVGKSTFKDEFVTCGGVRRSEINFETMESRSVPNLFFAGEVVDIDAITGGFNFQAAWTTAWIAASGMGKV